MKIDQETLVTLSTCLHFDDDDRVVIVEQLDRKAYQAVDKVLQACGGKWNRGKKAHLFEEGPGIEDPRSKIERVILTGEVTVARDDLAFFPTPVPLAKQLVTMAGVKKGWRVLEPSAGTGRIIDQVLAIGATVVAVERDPKMRAALQAKYLPRHVVLTLSDDFLNFLPGGAKFDAVVMNPPFWKVGEGDHLHHVRHAFDFLKSKGVLVSVLPNSVLFREDKRHQVFREWIGDHKGELVRLPEGSFKESGTNVNTCTLRMVAP